MHLHSTTDTGVQIRRVVAGRYILRFDGAFIGAVFGDYVIGFTATDKDGMNLGRHTTLDGAAVAVHTAWTKATNAADRLQYIEDCIRTEILHNLPVSA
jgi:hypothetical protein